MRAACVGWRVLPDAAVASASVVQRPPRVPVRFVRVPGAERREQSGGSRAGGELRGSLRAHREGQSGLPGQTGNCWWVLSRGMFELS